MATQFGDRIREMRIKQQLLLRQVASKLDVDTSIISKIERGERTIKKEQILVLAEMLKADKEELITLWLADQVLEVLKDQVQVNEVLKLVSDTINQNKKK